MKIKRIKKIAQEIKPKKDNIEVQNQYTVRSMFRDLSKWENFVLMTQ